MLPWQRTARVLGIATGLIALSIAGAVVVGVVFGILWLSMRAGTSGPGAKSIPALAAAAGFQAVMLESAVWRAVRDTGGSVWHGLGIDRIADTRRVGLCCLAALGWIALFTILIALSPELAQLVKSSTPDILLDIRGLGFFARASRFILLAILAPVSEELFFRGWLWESLRRVGNPIWLTALLTAVPWLLLHGIDAPMRIVFLIPAALLFSVARIWGRTVLGSLSVHLTNNLTAALIQTIGETAGGT